MQTCYHVIIFTKAWWQQHTVKIAINYPAAIIVVVHRQNGTSCSTATSSEFPLRMLLGFQPFGGVLRSKFMSKKLNSSFGRASRSHAANVIASHVVGVVLCRTVLGWAGVCCILLHRDWLTVCREFTWQEVLHLLRKDGLARSRRSS